MSVLEQQWEVAMRFIVSTLFLGGVFLATCYPAVWASTIRDDVLDSKYTSLGNSYSSSVGMVSIYSDSSTQILSGYASGTIVSIGSGGYWVLTAAHVTQDAGSMKFIINNKTYTATASSITSYSTITDGEDGNIADAGIGDLGLFYVSTTKLSGLTAASLYTGTTSSLLGETATYVGYGITGNGSTGADSWGDTYGTLRAVNNVLDETANSYFESSSCSSSILMSDFDSPRDSQYYSSMGDSTPLGLEGLICSGDSGGGVFVTINGTKYLVGVNSFGSVSDNRYYSTYGNYSGAVSVCDFKDWITTTIAVPEPGTFVLLAIGSVMLFGFVRFRRKQTA